MSRQPRKLNTKTGAYDSGIFVMTLDTNKEIPAIKDMDNETLAVFFHEYVHYLQDITTVTGYQNIHANSEYLKTVINRIINTPSKRFLTPFEINDNKDNVAVNLSIREETAGVSDSIQLMKIKDVKITNSKSIYQIRKFREATILCEDGKKLKFGSLAIMESMAYMLEQMCTDYLPSPDYPYNSAKLIAEHIVPEIAKDPISLIAVCDMSLLCSNPGPMFLTFLFLVRDGSIKIEKPEDIIDWFYATEYPSLNENQTVSLLENFKTMHTVAFNALRSYIKEIALGDEIKDYFDKMAERTLNLRENDRYFMINLARGGLCLKNEMFLKLVSQLGFPLLKNLNDEYYLYNNSLGNAENLQFFSAIEEISKMFFDGQDSCTMKKWCKHSPKSTPDFNCDIAPWKKIGDSRLCPYAFLWIHWGLKEYTPIKKEPLDELEDEPDLLASLTKS